MRSKVLSSTLGVVACAALGASDPASAAFGGENGRLAALAETSAGMPCGRGYYTCGYDGRIVTFRSDGRGQRRVARHVTARSSERYTRPVWSPDGRRIAFLHGTEPAVMNADGSHRRILTRDGFFYSIAWAADGRHLLLGGSSNQNANDGIYRMRADGRKLRRLTRGEDSNPAASSGGTIAFERRLRSKSFVYVIPRGRTRPRRALRGEDPDLSPGGRHLVFARDDGLHTSSTSGRRARQITDGHANTCCGPDREPAWAPDGSSIAFARDRDVYLVRSDGRRVRRVQVRKAAWLNWQTPSWQPLPR